MNVFVIASSVLQIAYSATLGVQVKLPVHVTDACSATLCVPLKLTVVADASNVVEERKMNEIQTYGSKPVRVSWFY